MRKASARREVVRIDIIKDCLGDNLRALLSACTHITHIPMIIAPSLALNCGAHEQHDATKLMSHSATPHHLHTTHHTHNDALSLKYIDTFPLHSEWERASLVSLCIWRALFDRLRERGFVELWLGCACACVCLVRLLNEWDRRAIRWSTECPHSA